MAKKPKLLKPRNSFVIYLMNRPSGVHGKTKKIQRRDDKVALKKEHGLGPIIGQ